LDDEAPAFVGGELPGVAFTGPGQPAVGGARHQDVSDALQRVFPGQRQKLWKFADNNLQFAKRLSMRGRNRDRDLAARLRIPGNSKMNLVRTEENALDVNVAFSAALQTQREERS